jgi:hypothetical protein
LEGQNLGTVFKQNGSIQIEKACLALRADRPLLNIELSASQNGIEILKPVYLAGQYASRQDNDVDILYHWVLRRPLS